MQRNAKPSVALITGAGRKNRVGATLASDFHARNYNVVIHCNNAKADAEVLCAKLNGIRENSAIVLVGDLNSDDLDSVATALITKAAAKWGNLNVLINSASIFEQSQPGKINLKNSARLMRVNAIAPLLLIQAFSTLLNNYSNETSGCVVNISDIFIKNASDIHAEYNASKAALEKITLDAAETFKNLRVAAVAPGAMLNPDGMSADSDNSFKYEGTALLIEKVMSIVNSNINKCIIPAASGAVAYPTNFFTPK